MQYTVTLDSNERTGFKTEGREEYRWVQTVLTGVSESRLRAIKTQMALDVDCPFWGIEVKAEQV